MGTLKLQKGKITLSVITITICTLAFVMLFYTETISRFSFRLKSCPRRNTAKKSSQDDRNRDFGALNYAADDRFEFDPEECSLVHGKWVFNRSIKPLYSDRTCRYLDRQVSCVKNGRPDSDYRHWEWQPDDCILPRFDPEIAEKRLQRLNRSSGSDGKSFVCLVDSVIPQGTEIHETRPFAFVFKAKEYNATIEFYWAPFLVESNSDLHIIADPKKRIMKVDSVAKHAKHWIGVDILVFDTYVWWMGRLRTHYGVLLPMEKKDIKNWTHLFLTIGLKTWANWVDSNLNPNRTRVFFTTMSPLHERCFNETKPITKKRYWGSGSNKQMMSVVARVVKRMKFPVTLINITQLSEYRIDAHTSIYTELGGKLLTDEQQADPLHYADCVHWCLPGVPDTWNQILYAHLL
ncbi:UNVERIFIED_CONTAM: protein trichome birefringence-like 3 [Sesamum radiatum]|uniref:Protein trichome birefringence-like 3 n=1 Tax=Sesamum radiatum TaxID=300843 RepID=A0AAW2KWQ0_SESRA